MAGYEDGPIEQGGWYYFGQGEVGDQQPDVPANTRLRSSVLTILPGQDPGTESIASQDARQFSESYEFVGDFHVVGVDFVVPATGPVRAIACFGSNSYTSMNELGGQMVVGRSVR